MRAIKYILNLAGILFLLFMSHLGFALIVKLPDCQDVMKVIWSTLTDTSLIYVLFVLIMTGFNLFFERRIEKRIRSREYLTIAAMSVGLLAVGTFYIAFNFHNHCGQ